MWRVTRYDPVAKHATLVNHKNEVIAFTVPAEHSTPELQKRYMQHQTDRHDLRHNIVVLILRKVGQALLHLKGLVFNG